MTFGTVQPVPDGEAYYEYLLVYVDDMLMLSHDPKMTMEAIRKVFKFKEGSVGKPSKCLGADVVECPLPGTSKPQWGFSFQKYVQEAFRNVEIELQKSDLVLTNTEGTRMSSGYCPELDVTPLIMMHREYIGIKI